MSDRIVDISEYAAMVRVRGGCLEISADAIGEHRIPLRDLMAVVLAHPQVVVTQHALASLAEARICVITSDAKRQPVGMILPIAAHTTQGERFVKQANLSRPTKKRLWQQIVREKLGAQSRCLAQIYGKDAGIAGLIRRVRSGDPKNVEAQAARRYWQALFPAQGFRRRRDGGHTNSLLNYGYAVLSAMTARAIAGAGLHPNLGLAHHNRYDSFCLARDLMEPYRPIVDRIAFAIADDAEDDAEPKLSSEDRRRILGGLTDRYQNSGESRTLFDWIARTAFSLTRVVMEGETKLEIAQL